MLEKPVRDAETLAPSDTPDTARDEDDLGLNHPDPVFSGLTEMMRSFVALAECLNLTHAVDRLKTTRQTVRRHIKLLEERRGAALFEIKDRQYALTTAGRQALPEAEHILGRSQAWYAGQIGRIDGLEAIRRGDPHPYFLQQQPISALWQQPDSLLHRGLTAWVAGSGLLDHPAMTAIRDNIIVFRRVRGEWICAEVGHASAFAQWFGPTWVRSAIGLPMQQMPGGRTFARVANRSYDEIEASHGLRFDHVYTHVGRPGLTDRRPFGLQRLLMGCRFADGSFALGNLALRSSDLNIDGLDPAMLQTMSDNMAEDHQMS